MLARRSARLSEKEEKKPPKKEEEEGSEEDEEEEEDEGSEYEDDGDRKAKQRRKARERREQIQKNKLAGRAVDPSTRTFGLGSASRAVSQAGRRLLESVHDQESDQIATTTTALEGATDSVTLPADVKPFVAFTALRRAKAISPEVRDIRTSAGTLNRGSDRQREQSRLPGPKRLNYPQVRGLGTYGAISSTRELPAERLLESEESARDPSTGVTTYAKRVLGRRGRLKRQREKGPESDLATQELAGANSLDPDIERLKTQNVGNTIGLLEHSDDPLATSTSGLPVFGRDVHQSLSRLIARPGSPTREDEAAHQSFRLHREAEELSGLRSPTPDEIHGLRGFSRSLPTTWSAPPPPLATAPASSSSVADPSGKSPEKKRRRKRKKKKKKKQSGSDG